jgi:gliding motility-associated-like protein
LPLGVVGQVNLVPNWSFEATNTCVLGQYQGIDTVWHDDPLDFDKVQQWMSPNYVTPDYFNACQTDVLSFRVSVPANFAGFQYAKTGQAYMGIIAYKNNIPFAPNGTAWEYIQTRLVSPLEAGAIYCGRFNASPSREDFDNITATDDLAMAVTKKPPRNNATPPYLDPSTDTGIYLDPQVINKGAVNMDTTAWQEIKSLFKAAGGEEWATIGVFVRKEDVDTFIIRPYTKPGFEQIWTAYYYIDDVSIVKVSEPVFSNRDTAVCDFPFLLTAQGGFDRYEWNTGDTTQSVQITAPGTYWVKVQLNECGELNDTIKVAAKEKTMLSLRDTSVCEEQLPLELAAPSGFSNYAWSNGETGQNASFAAPGWYALTASDECGAQSDSFLLTVLEDVPDFDLGDSTSICQDGRVVPVKLSPLVDLPVYEWSTGATTKTIIVDKPGIYSLRSFNACAEKQDDILVAGCPSRIYVPNIFSPNDDGENDVFTVFGQSIESVTLSVYSRWGELVYQEKGDVIKGWDGAIRGRPAESGVYVYLVTYKIPFSTKTEYVSGNLTLIR